MTDNSNMATLSMEPRKQIITFTTITNSSLIQSAEGNVFDSRNAVTARKPNVAVVTTVLK